MANIWEDRQDATRGYFYTDPDQAGRDAVLDYINATCDSTGDPNDDATIALGCLQGLPGYRHVDYKYLEYLYLDYQELDDEPPQFQFPMKKEICAGCDGEGRIPFGQHMSFTSREFDETFDDDESRHNYFAGHYDKTCPDCKGEKIIKSLDADRFKAEYPDLYQIYLDAVDGERQCNAESLAEYRMGC